MCACARALGCALCALLLRTVLLGLALACSLGAVAFSERVFVGVGAARVLRRALPDGAHAQQRRRQSLSAHLLQLSAVHVRDVLLRRYSARAAALGRGDGDRRRVHRRLAVAGAAVGESARGARRSAVCRKTRRVALVCVGRWFSSSSSSFSSSSSSSSFSAILALAVSCVCDRRPRRCRFSCSTRRPTRAALATRC